MKKNFSLWKNMFCLLGITLCFGLAGCAKDEPSANLDEQADAPVLLYYYNGIITADGELLFPPCDKEYRILQDKQNRQCYVLETEKQIDPKRLTYYGEPLLVGCTFHIYDVQGRLQKELSVQAEGSVDEAVSFYFAPDGTLEKSRILLNSLLTDGRLQILDCDGNVLLNEQIVPQEELAKWQNGYAHLEVAENFIRVFYDLYSNDGDMKNGGQFYDLNGQPLEMAQDYNYTYNMYDKYNGCVSGYYVASYVGPQGQDVYDVLNSNGQVVISGLTFVGNFSNGYLVVQQGFSRGLMDVQGNWVYQESQFTELED